jgi:hypothetical protein
MVGYVGRWWLYREMVGYIVKWFAIREVVDLEWRWVAGQACKLEVKLVGGWVDY